MTLQKLSTDSAIYNIYRDVLRLQYFHNTTNYRWLVNIDSNLNLILRIRLDTDYHASASAFFFFFFEACFVAKVLFQWVLYIVHGTHKPLFSTKLSLKMGLMTLFTFLKIILLQCFQFSTKKAVFKHTLRLLFCPNNNNQ